MKPMSTPMKLGMLLSSFYLFLACAAVKHETPTPETEVLNRPVLGKDTGIANDFLCRTYCSEIKLRTGIALLTWSSNERAFSNQRIDVTVYTNGFRDHVYTILWPIKTYQKFQTSSLVKLPDRDDNQRLFLTVGQVDFDQKSGRVSVELEGLEPSINYFWRVLALTKKGWVPSQTIDGAGPICPADMVDESNQQQ